MLGPPSCDDCKVWLKLDNNRTNGDGWYCPVCDKDSDSTSGYKHLSHGFVHNDSMIPFLRFMKGKNPHST